RNLARPEPASALAPRATLDALAPDLAELPLPFIRHQLKSHAEQMSRGLSALPLIGTLPLDRLPRTMTLEVNQDTPNDTLYPTHLLAVIAPCMPMDGQVAFIPIHGLVLGAHCDAPLLGDPPVPPIEMLRPGVLTLPVCRVYLPSMNAVFLLREYMYTERTEAVLRQLLMLPVVLPHSTVKAVLSSEAELLRLAAHLAKTHPALDPLVECSTRVRHVWQTACCMGMYHTPLWDALELAWELVVVALNL
ncbi:hypothetical protein B0H15DRAFT_750466, partial [Mycena belliarum]